MTARSRVELRAVSIFRFSIRMGSMGSLSLV